MMTVLQWQKNCHFWILNTCQLSRSSRESPSFSSNLSGLPVTAPNLPENTSRGLFQHCFINFVIFEMSKRKIKQELDSSALKTEQSNWYRLYLTRTVIGQKAANQIAQYVVESGCGHGNNSNCCSNQETSGTFGRASGDFRRVFRYCRKWHSYNAKIFRCLQIFVLWGLAGMILLQNTIKHFSNYVVKQITRPFLSSPLSPLQRESKCEVFKMVISCTFHMIENQCT